MTVQMHFCNKKVKKKKNMFFGSVKKLENIFMYALTAVSLLSVNNIKSRKWKKYLATLCDTYAYTYQLNGPEKINVCCAQQIL